MFEDAMHKKYSESPQNRRDEAMRSCGFAAQTIMLAAKQMGLDSCPMVGFEYDEIAKIINLPDEHHNCDDDCCRKGCFPCSMNVVDN